MSRPDCPRLLNCALGASSGASLSLVNWRKVSPSPSTLAGAVCPFKRVRIGFGSNVSIWLGPPCIKRWITAFALAGKCDGRAASGLLGGPAAIRPPEHPGEGRHRSRRRLSTRNRGGTGTCRDCSWGRPSFPVNRRRIRSG